MLKKLAAFGMMAFLIFGSFLKANEENSNDETELILFGEFTVAGVAQGAKLWINDNFGISAAGYFIESTLTTGSSSVEDLIIGRYWGTAFIGIPYENFKPNFGIGLGAVDIEDNVYNTRTTGPFWLFFLDIDTYISDHFVLTFGLIRSRVITDGTYTESGSDFVSEGTFVGILDSMKLGYKF